MIDALSVILSGIIVNGLLMRHVHDIIMGPKTLCGYQRKRRGLRAMSKGRYLWAWFFCATFGGYLACYNLYVRRFK